MILAPIVNLQRATPNVHGAVSFLSVLSIAAVFWYLAEDWIAGAAILVLWFMWKIVPRIEGPPVLALALTFQWAQVVAAIIYLGITGRRIADMDTVDYRPMVLVGLGCVLALAVGLWMGARPIKSKPMLSLGFTCESVLRTPTLVLTYLGATACSGALTRLAWGMPGFTQPLLVLSLCRYTLFYLLVRRFIFPRFRWYLAAVLLGFEVLVGFSGYFAGFREAEVLVFLAILEILRPRYVRHWLALGLVLALAGCTAILWLAIRTQVRATIDADETIAESEVARLQFAGALSSRQLPIFSQGFWTECDNFISRMWTIPLPARALVRVPSVLPYEHGAILSAALRHIITPRMLFPDKPELPSDSEEVRKYAGVWVAGAKENTSIAFGYAAESYVDFGTPGMFVPVFFLGIFMGLAYRFFLQAIHNRELAVGFVATVFWLCLYLFERSWVKMLGFSGTLMIYAGLATVMVDRYLMRLSASRRTVRVPRVTGTPQAFSRVGR